MNWGQVLDKIPLIITSMAALFGVLVPYLRYKKEFRYKYIEAERTKLINLAEEIIKTIHIEYENEAHNFLVLKMKDKFSGVKELSINQIEMTIEYKIAIFESLCKSHNIDCLKFITLIRGLHVDWMLKYQKDPPESNEILQIITYTIGLIVDEMANILKEINRKMI